MPDYTVSMTVYIFCRCEKLPCSTTFCEACMSSFSNCVTVYVVVSHLNLVSHSACLSRVLFLLSALRIKQVIWTPIFYERGL